MTTLTVTLTAEGLLPGESARSVLSRSVHLYPRNFSSSSGCHSAGPGCPAGSLRFLHSLHLAASPSGSIHVLCNPTSNHCFARKPSHDIGTFPSLPLKSDQQLSARFGLHICLKSSPVLTRTFQINTVLQLLLMGSTTVSPIIPLDISDPLYWLQCAFTCSLSHICSRSFRRWIVATTTIWSGLSYIFAKDAIRVISQSRMHK
jgi:hypothetical protein